MEKYYRHSVTGRIDTYSGWFPSDQCDELVSDYLVEVIQDGNGDWQEV